MPLPLCVVDAFTREAFRGNPAAVCLPGPDATTAWMQSVAAELNLSETAFAVPLRAGHWRLRWFTQGRSGLVRPRHPRYSARLVGSGRCARLTASVL